MEVGSRRPGRERTDRRGLNWRSCAGRWRSGDPTERRSTHALGARKGLIIEMLFNRCGDIPGSGVGASPYPAGSENTTMRPSTSGHRPKPGCEASRRPPTNVPFLLPRSSILATLCETTMRACRRETFGRTIRIEQSDPRPITCAPSSSSITRSSQIRRHVEPFSPRASRSSASPQNA